MCKLFVGLIIGICFLFCSFTSAQAVNVTLTWDANIETNLAGYRLFCREQGEEYNYEYPDWDGTEIEGTITDLAEGLVYYFVARAYSTEGLESGNSNEVCYDGTVQTTPTEPEPNELEEPENNKKNNRGCFINTLNI